MTETLSARQIADFSAYCWNATDAQLHGIMDKERKAGRDAEGELVRLEAARRPISLD